MKNNAFLLALLIGFNLWSCKTLQPLAPSLQPGVLPEIPVEESFINLPIEVSLDAVGKLLNENVVGILYHEEGMDVGYGIKMDIEVGKDDKILVSTYEGKIITNVPIYIKGKVSWRGALGIGASKSFDGKIAVYTGTSLMVDENWNIKAKTETDFKMDKAPSVNVLGREIGFGSIAKDEIKTQLPYINKVIDDYINEAVDLRTEMQNVWQILNQPIALAEEPVKTWLILEPTQFSYSPPVSDGIKKIRLNLGARLKAKTTVGTKPLTKSLGTLPKLQTKTAEREDFSIALPIVIEISEIKEAVREQVVGQTYEMTSKRSVTVNSLDLYGAGNKMVVSLGFKSKRIKGKLFLVGIPYYDKATRRVSLRDLDFSTSTNNMLAGSASWIADKLFIKKIQKSLYYEVGSYLDEARAEAQTTLDSYSMKDYMLSVKSDIKRLDIDTLHIKDNHLFIYGVAEGKLNIMVK